MNYKIYIKIHKEEDGKEIAALATWADLPDNFSMSSNKGIQILRDELTRRLDNLSGLNKNVIKNNEG